MSNYVRFKSLGGKPFSLYGDAAAIRAMIEILSRRSVVEVALSAVKKGLGEIVSEAEAKQRDARVEDDNTGKHEVGVDR